MVSMPICVFISATSEDLEQDCTPSVKRAIGNKAVPIEMKTWIADFIDGVNLCRQKIETESSHYLGLFAYRRGWVPGELKGKSITEAEFDWACEYKKIMAVLLPNRTTKFAEELRRRAAGQSKADSEAQEAFLKRVGALGAYMTFDDLAHLEGNVASIVTRWTMGGIRAFASQGRSSEAEGAFVIRPRGDEIIQLGRKAHVREFEDAFGMLPNQQMGEVACFLIHGQAGYGHQEMIARLRKKLEESAGESRYCRVDIRPDWRRKDVAMLLEIIGREIDSDRIPNSTEALAARLKEVLEVGDLILEFTDLQRLEGSLPGFVRGFWEPIVSSLTEAPRHRLIGLLSFEQLLDPGWGQYLYCQGGQEPFDASRVIVLPELNTFKEDELIVWLREHGLPVDKAKACARTLIAETGGHPSVLYRKLEIEAL